MGGNNKDKEEETSRGGGERDSQDELYDEDRKQKNPVQGRACSLEGTRLCRLLFFKLSLVSYLCLCFMATHTNLNRI